MRAVSALCVVLSVPSYAETPDPFRAEIVMRTGDPAPFVDGQEAGEFGPATIDIEGDMTFRMTLDNPNDAPGLLLRDELIYHLSSTDEFSLLQREDTALLDCDDTAPVDHPGQALALPGQSARFESSTIIIGPPGTAMLTWRDGAVAPQFCVNEPVPALFDVPGNGGSDIMWGGNLMDTEDYYLRFTLNGSGVPAISQRNDRVVAFVRDGVIQGAVLQSDTPAPGLEPIRIIEDSCCSTPWLSVSQASDGSMALISDLRLSTTLGVTAENRRVVYALEELSATLVMRSGDELPGLPGTTVIDAAEVRGFQAGWLVAATTLAPTLNVSSEFEAIVIVDDLVAAIVFREGDSAPEIDGAVLNSFDLLASNKHGDYIFGAELMLGVGGVTEANDKAYYLVRAGSPTLLFREGDELGSEVIRDDVDFEDPNVWGDVWFANGFISSFSGSPAAWGVYDGVEGEAMLVTGPAGSALQFSPSGPVNTVVEFRGSGFNDDRDGAFALTFDTPSGETISELRRYSLVPTPACSLADVAEPFGVSDLADIDAFIVGFLAGDSVADIAAPPGVIDLADIDAFIVAFLAGCP